MSGADVVDFSAGEPDFPTPENIKQAAVGALEQNFTKYTAVGGMLDLKQVVCDRHTPRLTAPILQAGQRVHCHGRRQTRDL